MFEIVFASRPYHPLRRVFWRDHSAAVLKFCGRSSSGTLMPLARILRIGARCAQLLRHSGRTQSKICEIGTSVPS